MGTAYTSNATSMTWDQSANWSPNGVPGPTDSVTIRSTDTVTASAADVAGLGGTFPTAPSAQVAYNSSTAASLTALNGAYIAAITCVDGGGNESGYGASPVSMGTFNSTTTKPRVTMPTLPAGAVSFNLYLSSASGSITTATLYKSGLTSGQTWDLTSATWENAGQTIPSHSAKAAIWIKTNGTTATGKLVITGRTLTVNSYVIADSLTTLAAAITIQPNGSTPGYLVFDGQAANVRPFLFMGTKSTLNVAGTSSGAAGVNTKSGTTGLNAFLKFGDSGYGTFSSGMASAYGLFARLGDATQDAFLLCAATASYALPLNWTNSKFDSCGRLNITNLATGNGAGGLGVHIDYCAFTNSQHATTSVVVNDGVTGTNDGTSVLQSYFDKAFTCTTGKKINAVQSTFAGSFNITSTSGPMTAFTKSLVRFVDGRSGAIGGPAGFPSGISNVYGFADGLPEADNFHMGSVTPKNGSDSVTNCIAENSRWGGDGETFMDPGESGAANLLTYTGILSVPTGFADGSMDTISTTGMGATTTQTLAFYHSTIGCQSSKPLYFGENSTHLPAGTIVAMKANITALPYSSNYGPKLNNINSSDTTVDVATLTGIASNAGNNCALTGTYTKTNAGNGYGTTCSSTPGTADLDVTLGSPCALPPSFVDPFRGVPRFDREYLGNVASKGAWAASTSYSVGDTVTSQVSTYYNNAIINYRCINAHTSVSGDNQAGQPGATTATVQYINFYNSPSGGTFLIRLPYGTVNSWGVSQYTSTSAITYSTCTAATVQTALNTALASGGHFGSTTCTVTGSNAAGYVVTFSAPVHWMIMNSDSLTGTNAYATCPDWSTNWQFATLYSVQLAYGQIAAGTGGYITDASLGLSNATPAEAIAAWVRDGFRPTAAAYSGSVSYGGDTYTTDPNGNAISGIGVMAWKSSGSVLSFLNGGQGLTCFNTMGL